MQLEVDKASLRKAVGTPTYERGSGYLVQGRVVNIDWDEHNLELHGLVVGKSLYTVTAYLTPTGRGATMQYDGGECSCPMAADCKHVVAVVLSAADGDGDSEPGAGRPGQQALNWADALGAALAIQQPSAATQVAMQDSPLAVELSITSDRNDREGIHARLVRPGKRGWVRGNLSWSKIDMGYYMGDYPDAMVRVLREMYSIYKSHQPGRAYPNYYGYDEKTIDLTQFESRSLWPLLDDARKQGLQIVHGNNSEFGEVPPYEDATVQVDVSHGDEPGSLVVRPHLCIDGTGADVHPVMFIGSHGVVFRRDSAGRADEPIQLARLARDVPPELQRVITSGAHYDIPASDADQFVTDFYPAMRQVVDVVSRDGSFTPPEISPPTLQLTAAYGDDHVLDLTWEWTYQVGDVQRRRRADRPVEPTDTYRDSDAEAAIMTALPPGALLHAHASGLDTMRYTTEMLPLLRDQPGVEVVVTGEPADYREATDSLRIGVSVEDDGADRDWFDLGVSVTVDGYEVPLAQMISAISRGEQHLLLISGAYFALDKPELQTLRRLIEEARELQDRPGGLKINRFQAGLWEELAALGIVDQQAGAWQRQVGGLLNLAEVPHPEVPASLDAELRPYQVDGFQWLSFLWKHQLGGILADDMGLGKTLQALALISQVKLADPDMHPVLIVAPTSVVPNWVAEARRFAPDLRVASVSGTRRRRGGRSIAELTEGADVVVTSYTLLRLDYDTEYAQIDWSALILDEAQFVKNHQSKTYQACRKLPAPFKLAITGTPMENNLMELWALLSITAPGLFPSPSKFENYYAKPIEKSQDNELLPQLRQRVKPLMRRRTKEQVATELPEKQEQVLEVDLHPRHRTVYDRHLQRERQKILGLIGDMNKNRFTILRSLTLLRQLSLHAGLVDDADGHLPSAKVDALLDHLGDVIDSGHQALVFSQFTRFLSVVRNRLDAAGIPYVYLDGKTRDRDDVISRFKGGEAPVFLISLKAGGFGLNLTEADYCFLLDPWWNPATEAQAVDRTHRIGQTRNVMVYRLIAKDTIEEKVLALQQRKAELFASVMDEGNAFGSSLTADDIRGLFT